MGRWGQKPAAPQKSEQVETYQLSATDLEELYRKYGKPGEIAPGVKAERGRDNHRRQQAANNQEEAAAPPPEILGEIEASMDKEHKEDAVEHDEDEGLEIEDEE